MSRVKAAVVGFLLVTSAAQLYVTVIVWMAG